MLKYAKIINDKTKVCEVGLGDDSSFYESIGMSLMDVEEGDDFYWYIKGYAPIKVITKEEVEQTRAYLYTKEVDPLTAQINRLRDEEQTPDIISRIEELKIQRSEKVSEIKANNPYPEESIGGE